MTQRVNFVVKARGVKATDIRKALEEAGIEVRSVVEIFREEEAEDEVPHQGD